MASSNVETAALLEKKRLRTGDAEEKRKRMKRAVADVMDGVVPLNAACRNRGVDYDALRTELASRGWKPIRIRQTNCRSRRKT